MKLTNKQLGFTLVELLLVMAILAVLSALSLAIINDAQFEARANATRSRLTLIDAIFKQKLENYEFMRSPVNEFEYFGRPERIRELRRRVVAEFINWEMPQEAEDVSDAPSSGFQSYANNAGIMGVIADLQNARPAASFQFQAQISDVNLPGEFLYLILQSTDANGQSAIEALSPNSFVDTDNDSIFEVVDSWGNQISFEFETLDETTPQTDDYVSTDLNYDENESVPFVRDIRIRLESTGNDIETISNLPF